MFGCKDAGTLLGHPEAEVGPCQEVLPGVWRVVLKAPGIGPGDAVVRTFAWHDGQAEAAGGMAQLATVLKRMQAHERDAATPFEVQVLLEATGSAPPGFTPHAVSGNFGGEKAAIRARPFGVTLVTTGWSAPAAPFTPIPGGPQTPPTGGPAGPAPGSAPTGGPAGPAPGSAPTGGPSGPAPGSAPTGGPSGPAPGSGVAPPTIARATLALDSNYRGQWTIEVQRVPGGPFQTELTVPVEAP
jgi:hypothetical protein